MTPKKKQPELPADLMNLMVRKGELPLTVPVPGQALAELEPAPAPEPPRVGSAQTVKLDADRFERLDFARFKRKTSAQKILVEALDRWLKEEGF